MCGQCVFDGKGEHECDYTRPITLADVLRAIKDKYMKGTLQKEGEFKNGTEWFGEIAWDWNLAKDNLDDQSPETIDFLTSVLCNG